MRQNNDENHSDTSEQQDLATLQSMMLESVLAGRPLPGSDAPVSFPDLSFVLRHESVYVLDQNLAGKISVADVPKQVRIVSLEELKEVVRQEGDVAYFVFEAAEIEGAVARITLQAKLMSPDPAQPALGLGGISVQFERQNGVWHLIDRPALFAM